MLTFVLVIDVLHLCLIVSLFLAVSAAWVASELPTFGVCSNNARKVAETGPLSMVSSDLRESMQTPASREALVLQWERCHWQFE